MSTEISPDILRSLGRIEGNQEQMNERLREMNGRFDRVDARFDRTDTRFDRADARFDRLLLALLAVGATIVAALIVILVKLFLGA
jgi:predicted nuclease with TOPRIM domain